MSGHTPGPWRVEADEGDKMLDQMVDPDVDIHSVTEVKEGKADA